MTVKGGLRALVVTMVVFLALTAASSALGQLYEQREGQREFTSEMMVRPLQVEHWMERGFTREEAEELHRQTTEWLVEFLGGRLISHHQRMDRDRFRLNFGENENEIGAFLLQRGGFRYVCPNWHRFPLAKDCPNDEYLSSQWHHLFIESCARRQRHTEGDDDVVIATFDIGLRRSHEDLSTLSQYRREAYNSLELKWESEGATLFDSGSGLGHGTLVTGAAAATGNNSHGVSGVGWLLRHRMIKTTGTESEMFDAMWLILGIEAGDRVLSFQYAPDGDTQRNRCGTMNRRKSRPSMTSWSFARQGIIRHLKTTGIMLTSSWSEERNTVARPHS